MKAPSSEGAFTTLRVDRTHLTWGRRGYRYSRHSARHVGDRPGRGDRRDGVVEEGESGDMPVTMVRCTYRCNALTILGRAPEQATGKEPNVRVGEFSARECEEI